MAKMKPEQINQGLKNIKKQKKLTKALQWLVGAMFLLAIFGFFFFNNIAIYIVSFELFVMCIVALVYLENYKKLLS